MEHLLGAQKKEGRFVRAEAVPEKGAHASLPLVFFGLAVVLEGLAEESGIVAGLAMATRPRGRKFTPDRVAREVQQFGERFDVIVGIMEADAELLEDALGEAEGEFLTAVTGLLGVELPKQCGARGVSRAAVAGPDNPGYEGA